MHLLHKLELGSRFSGWCHKMQACCLRTVHMSSLEVMPDPYLVLLVSMLTF